MTKQGERYDYIYMIIFGFIMLASPSLQMCKCHKIESLTRGFSFSSSLFQKFPQMIHQSIIVGSHPLPYRNKKCPAIRRSSSTHKDWYVLLPGGCLWTAEIVVNLGGKPGKFRDSTSLWLIIFYV